MPERVNQKILAHYYGVCSDYVEQIKNGLNY